MRKRERMPKERLENSSGSPWDPLQRRNRPRRRLNVKSGQITGMFGLCGSGRTEFLECIYGTRKLAGGEVTIDGKTTDPPCSAGNLSDREWRSSVRIGEGKHDPVFTVEEKHDALLHRPLHERRLVPETGGMQKGGGHDQGVKDQVHRHQPAAKELSGGNQQKVVFAKALLTEPSIWLCDEPTQAVDVATRQEIHRLLREEAKKARPSFMYRRTSRSFLRSPTRLLSWHNGKYEEY